PFPLSGESTMTHRNIIVPFAVLTILAASGLLSAGPLTPPGGPVSSTNKTLLEVEPRIAINATNTPGDATNLFRITQPGSYYLTGNITGVSGKNGIGIAASGVTLDLNGFDLVGVAGSLAGVNTVVNSLRNIAVVNGSVRNWGGRGVEISALSQVNCRVERVLASANGDVGIAVNLNGTITACSAHGNGSSGISAGTSTAVSSCSAFANGGSGIGATFGCSISNCAMYQNTGSGISTSTGCTVTGCTAYDNSGDGIAVFTGCTVSNCTTR